MTSETDDVINKTTSNPFDITNKVVPLNEAANYFGKDETTKQHYGTSR